jgi:NADH-quinone oxidoreductase subunit J
VTPLAADLTGHGGPGFLSPTGAEVAFVLVGLVVLAGAVLVVTTRQIVHAALWLVVTLGGLAAEYLLLTAEFIAWVQVLIYIGAVVVLLLFGLMLTRAPIGPSAELDSVRRWPGVLVAVGAGATLLTVVIDAFHAAYLDLGNTKDGSARVTGESLFRVWVLPFEVLSVLLLAALIGAIVLSRGRSAEQKTNGSR